MNKPLLLSLAAAALLTTNVNAQTMFERFQAMENEMAELRKEIATLKTQKGESEEAEEKEDSEDKKEAEDSDEKEDAGDKEDEKEEMDVEEEITEIQESISELNKATSGNHLKFGVDYRFTLENLNYKMADGSEANNDAFMTNRLWLNMDWAATKNLSFTGQLAYNKAFGQRSGASTPASSAFEGFDWISNENAYDDTLRVRSAYFLYRNNTFIGTDVPWTFSVGRRPSTNGHIISLRDDDKPASPMGHTINVEFDGLSSKFSFDKWVDGMYIKLCAGRGMSNAAPKFNSTPYTSVTSANTNIDLAGLIFVPYDNGQYSIGTQYYYANNLIDVKNTADYTQGFDTVGGLHSMTANFVVNGIGNEISDFLDDTTFFVSGAMSITNPNSDQRMLYASMDSNMVATATGESKTGYSYWVGTQFPSLITEDGRWGLEYNHGSEYWRSITYGEDTNIGSKVAARGDAYEAYMTEYLIEDILSMQIRYTYIDYAYSGSNGFFGGTSGASMDMNTAIAFGQGANVVDSAQDIRFYLRYKY
ncbi:DUF3373 family protein [Sulfurimonas sp.]|uniref:DUF3373 family protein n=1 Tax=Sulfurimonas sp. TaxID=2022749 RepID=UPI00356B1BEB